MTKPSQLALERDINNFNVKSLNNIKDALGSGITQKKSPERIKHLRESLLSPASPKSAMKKNLNWKSS